MTGNPNYGIILESYPFVARKLLSEDRPVSYDAIHYTKYTLRVAHYTLYTTQQTTHLSYLTPSRRQPLIPRTQPNTHCLICTLQEIQRALQEVLYASHLKYIPLSHPTYLPTNPRRSNEHYKKFCTPRAGKVQPTVSSVRIDSRCC